VKSTLIGLGPYLQSVLYVIIRLTSKHACALQREKISYPVTMEDENINFCGLSIDDYDGIPLSSVYVVGLVEGCIGASTQSRHKFV
jgi:hypothetical protein